MKARTAIMAALVLGLAACGQPDVVLPGDRVDVRPDQRAAVAPVNRAVPLSLPAPVANADWTHRNGGPSHRITHPALGPALTPVFAAGIGQGDSRRARITADPVVAGGVIYTLDAAAQVTATGTGGQTLWSRDLRPATAGRTIASGGGVAVDGGRIYATTGFGTLSALDAATGAVVWTQDLDAPGNAAPTVLGGLVYVVGRDSRAWAIETATGRVAWQLSGVPGTAGFGGGAGAAVTSEIAVFPLPSGEVLAAFPQGGLRRWSSVIAGARPGQAAAVATDDIGGDPVIDGNRVYVGNVSGRVVALDLATGNRIWTATEGAVSPVWPAGGALFLLNDLNQLVRLDAATGAPVWRTQLPLFTTDRPRRQSARFAHYGPVLAGGRLVVASSDGVLRQFDPVSGAGLGEVALPGGAASNPVVAGQTLYVVSKRGELLAFR